MCVGIWREGDKRIDSAQWCQAVEKRQWAETDTQKVPPEHGEKLLYCAGDYAQEWIAKRICGVSHTGDFPNRLDTIQCHELWDYPAWQGRLDQITPTVVPFNLTHSEILCVNSDCPDTRVLKNSNDGDSTTTKTSPVQLLKYPTKRFYRLYYEHILFMSALIWTYFIHLGWPYLSQQW